MICLQAIIEDARFRVGAGPITPSRILRAPRAPAREGTDQVPETSSGFSNALLTRPSFLPDSPGHERAKQGVVIRASPGMAAVEMV